jgi:cell division protein FtsX
MENMEIYFDFLQQGTWYGLTIGVSSWLVSYGIMRVWNMFVTLATGR